jgi:LysM repeat protein
MFKKIMIAISITAVVGLFLAACERSVGKPVLATPNSTNAGSTLNATPESTNINLVSQWATATAVYNQTAVAMGLITAAPTSTTPEASPSPTPLGTLSTTVVPPAGQTTLTAGATNTPLPGTTPVATLPVVIVPTATPGRPVTYTLQAGEFPYCLARRFNVNISDLLSLNGLADGQILQPGLILSIPQSGSFVGDRALHSHPAQYTVNVGDTIYTIACYFGDVDPTSIAAANSIALTTPLTTGRLLSIP